MIHEPLRKNAPRRALMHGSIFSAIVSIGLLFGLKLCFGWRFEYLYCVAGIMILGTLFTWLIPVRETSLYKKQLGGEELFYRKGDNPGVLRIFQTFIGIIVMGSSGVLTYAILNKGQHVPNHPMLFIAYVVSYVLSFSLVTWLIPRYANFTGYKMVFIPVYQYDIYGEDYIGKYQGQEDLSVMIYGEPEDTHNVALIKKLYDAKCKQIRAENEEANKREKERYANNSWTTFKKEHLELAG